MTDSRTNPDGISSPSPRRSLALLTVMSIALLACNLLGTPTLPVDPGPPPTVTPRVTRPDPTSPPTPARSPEPAETSLVADDPTPTSPPTRPMDRSEAVCYEGDCADAAFDYLVVTRPMFFDALTPFVNWKSTQGFRVGVVSVDWLAGEYAGRHLAERMKTGMHDLRRRATDDGALYVLLVGDTEMAIGDFSIDAVMDSYDLSIDWNVPTGFYRRIHNDPPHTVLPSDVYFVEDRDWDPGNTGLNPVPDQSQGQGLFEATLFLGRWSVRKPEEIGPIFDKTRSVAPARRILFASDQEFSGSGLCTSWPPTGPSGVNGYPSCYVNSEIVMRRLFGNVLWLTTDSMVVDVTDGAQTDVLIDTFLNYEGVIHSNFHGFYYYLDLSKAGAGCCTPEELQFGSAIPLLILTSCDAAAFYTGSRDTVIETVLKSPTGPAVIAQPGHNEYHFADYLLQGYSIGQSFWQAGSDYAFWLNPIVLFGDPSQYPFYVP